MGRHYRADSIFMKYPTAFSKRYRSFEAVEGVSCSIAAGEVIGILGPNGAGKTTTLEILVATAAVITSGVRVAAH